MTTMMTSTSEEHVGNGMAKPLVDGTRPKHSHAQKGKTMLVASSIIIACMAMMLLSPAAVHASSATEVKNAHADARPTPKQRVVAGTKMQSSSQLPQNERSSNHDFLVSHYHHSEDSQQAESTSEEEEVGENGEIGASATAGMTEEEGDVDVDGTSGDGENQDDVHPLYKFGFGSNLKADHVNKMHRCNYSDPKTFGYCPPVVDPRIMYN